MSTLAVVIPPKEKETEKPLIQEINLNSIKPSRANPRRRMERRGPGGVGREHRDAWRLAADSHPPCGRRRL